jgi:hypothetical protein
MFFQRLEEGKLIKQSKGVTIPALTCYHRNCTHSLKNKDKSNNKSLVINQHCSAFVNSFRNYSTQGGKI